MTERRLLPCGEQAVLVEVDGLESVLALAAAVRTAVDQQVPGFGAVTDVVPAARTVLVQVADGADLAPLREGLATLPAAPVPPAADRSGTPVVIVVRYDGPDLAAVADLTGLTPHEVVAAHTGRPWRVAFGGFAPGFAYLVGGDPRLRVPRRAEPRTAVPAGAVALAGEFSAVYPRASPGGWQLIGRTEATMFEVHRDPPALLRPGMTVRFVAEEDRR
ncbi:MAG: 5-oxoprolinase subunit B family protein [Actinomycetes bacterium]